MATCGSTPTGAARWPTGMRILAEQAALPAILAISLFTNDHPRDTRALEAAVRATAGRPRRLRGLGDDRGAAVRGRQPRRGERACCAGWRAIRRSSSSSSTGRGRWQRDPSLMSADEVHASPAGYRARARMYADAIRACAGRRAGRQSVR